jgi:TolB-like protein
MSPEQALGHPIDHRSDLFSLGVILYEILTGRLPFAGQTSVEVVNAILNQAPPAIARFNDRVPDGLVAIVNKLLEKDRERRYQSAREVRIDLDRMARDRRTPSGSGAPPAVLVRPARRVVWIAAAAVLVALAGTGWVLWNRSRPAPGLNAAASVVVLPADVFGPPELQYLTDAVPATLSSHLAEIAGLETKVPPTHLEWEAVKRDAQQMVRAYAVALYVAPHVYVQAGRLSITFQLVEGSTRKMIWSRDYVGTPDTYLTEIRQAADDLRSVLRPEARAIVAPAGRTASSEAELAFQQGTHFWNRFNNLHETADFDVSLASLTRALRLDPTMADAAAEVALLYLFKAEGNTPFADVQPDIEQWARRAIAIDEKSGIAWAAMSILELYNPNPDNTLILEHALRAAKYAPRTPIAQNILGIAIESDALRVEAHRRALALDPFYRAAANNLTNGLYSLNRSAEAVTVINEILAREPALARSFITNQVANLVNLGRTDEAQALFAQIPPAAATSLFGRVAEINLMLARQDATADARIDGVLDALSAPATSAATVLTIVRGLVPPLGQHGRLDAALRGLTLCLQRGRLPPYDGLATDDRLVSLRRDPRFQPSLGRAKASLATTLSLLEAARGRNELPSYLDQPLKDLRVRLGM